MFNYHVYCRNFNVSFILVLLRSIYEIFLTPSINETSSFLKKTYFKSQEKRTEGHRKRRGSHEEVTKMRHVRRPDKITVRFIAF